MMVLLLTLLLIAPPSGAALASPLGELHTSAVLGGLDRAGIDDEEGGGAITDWHERRALYVVGDFAQWTGVLGDNFGSSIGVSGGYAFGARPNLIIRGGGGFHYFQADAIVGGPRGASAKLAVVPLLVAADYLLKRDGAVRPFIGGGIGPTFVRADFEDPSVTYFAFDDLLDAYLQAQVRAGFTILRANSNLGIEVLGVYNLVVDQLEEFNMGSQSHHDHIGVAAGVTYFLGSDF